MSDTNAASLGWVVRVSETGREYRFYAGDSVVIGRTPLRPAALHDDHPRLDIDDPNKSMSKRHALFSVNADGSATLHDLHSTNGTYLVRPDGELMRLPVDQDYAVSSAALRLQLGDVGIEIHREAGRGSASANPHVGSNKNADLFSHAAQALPEGVDSPGLSVDQILDVRAGEPTEMFNAQKVRKHVLGKKEATEAKQTSEKADAQKPESGFARLKQDLEQQSQLQRDYVEKSEESIGEKAPIASDSKPQPQSTHSAGPEDGQPAANPESLPQQKAEAQREPVASSAPEQTYDARDVQGGAAAVESSPAAATPTFEPGSVFDRLTRGELDSHKPAVVIGELNSDDAQHTDDQSLQFEMAKHHELLPFLALNPHLYDDLYAWLEAISDPDILEALRNNAGYVAYQEGRN